MLVYKRIIPKHYQTFRFKDVLLKYRKCVHNFIINLQLTQGLSYQFLAPYPVYLWSIVLCFWPESYKMRNKIELLLVVLATDSVQQPHIGFSCTLSFAHCVLCHNAREKGRKCSQLLKDVVILPTRQLLLLSGYHFIKMQTQLAFRSLLLWRASNSRKKIAAWYQPSPNPFKLSYCM